MRKPGFSAEASVYKSIVHYSAGFSAHEPLSGNLHASLGISGGGGCHPFAVCIPDKSSPTGCMLIGINAQCQPIGVPCRGCTCPPGLTNCTIGCVDLKTDPNNCGVCRQVCTGGKICQNGRCVCVVPTPTDCNGTCTSLLNDPNNCGACGLRCPPGDFCSPGPDGIPGCFPIT